MQVASDSQGSSTRIGPYRLTKMLAEGGMGVVHRAVHDATGEPVALKLVRVTSEGMLASFRREIFALRSLEHPSVVRVVADGVHDGQPWYAMTLLHGETLGDYIDAQHARTPAPTGYDLLRSNSTSVTQAPVAHAHTERPPGDPIVTADTLSSAPVMTEDRLIEILGVLRALCSPLAYVHSRGLVHRDLKPDNVLIRRDGVPVLVDFGLAQLFDADRSRAVLDVAGRVLGTPAYMAPEQIRGDLVDARADLYAVGCLLFEALTGQPPFDGNAQEVLRQHLYEPAPRPSSMVAGLPPKLDELVAKLLHKTPSRRLGYAQDVAYALAELGAPELPIGEVPRPAPYLYRPALAGRSPQLAQIQRALRFANPESGAFVLVGGPSGVGKTRLAMELATLGARRAMTVVTAQCQDMRAGSDAVSVRAAPLHPFRPLLLAIADRCRAAGLEHTEALLGNLGPVLAPYEPSLRELPGQAERPAPPELPAEAGRIRLLDALAQATIRFADVNPAFILVDDLQWADELSLAFLGHLQARDFDRVPLVLLGTYRTEEESEGLTELMSRDHVTAFEVGPLDRDAVADMVGDMLALDAPPPSLIEFLMEESAGHPFFIAEYLRTAIGEGVLRRATSGEWRVGASADTRESLREALPVPGGMMDLMRRRFAQVSRSARSLAEMAAVLGREVDGELLLDAMVAVDGRASARSGSASADRAALEELRRATILEEAERGRLRFVHDKLREFVHEQLEPVRCGTMHHAAASCIEARHGQSDDRALHYPALAHHYALAGQRDKTIEYLEKAGEHALVSAAPGEARRFFERAFALDDEQPAAARANDERRARWSRRLGEALYQVGELGPAHEHLSRAVELLTPQSLVARLVDDPNLKGWLSSAAAMASQVKRLAGADAPVSERREVRERLREAALAAERLSQVHYFQNNQGLAFGAAFACAEHAEGLGPSPELARAYGVLSVAVGFIPMFPLVERYGRRARQIADESGDPHAIAFTRMLRGLNNVHSGRYDKARRELAAGIEVARDIGDIRSAMEMTAIYAQAHALSGDFASGLSLYRELETEARRVHDLQAIQWSVGGQALSLTFMGKLSRALEMYDESARVESGDETQHISHGIRSWIYMMQGDWERALSMAREILELVDGTAPTGYVIVSGLTATAEVLTLGWERARLRGASRTEQKRLRDESNRACRAVERFARIFPLARSSAELYRGLWQLQLGRRRRARHAFERALEAARANAGPQDQARALLELGRMERPGSRLHRRHVQQARSLFDEVDMPWWRSYADDLLSSRAGITS
jgi:serine/threonine protein kinase/tetratricopeptide (TPR) repeat protein